MRRFLFLFCLPLAAQEHRFDEAFFRGDRKVILQACADMARSMKPKDAKWLAEYGRAYLAALDRPKAEAAFRDALAREPKDGEVLRLIGQAWLKHGYKREAMEAYLKIFAVDAGNKDALVASALDLAEVGLAAEAERFAMAYFQKEKDEWKVFLQFGKAYLASGHRNLAAKWFAKAVELKPKEEDLYLEISRAFAESQALL